MKIAIIGTAGRDANRHYTRTLWDQMLEDARSRIPEDTHLVSGGAAWADHLAVALFLEGHASALTLHLPAPLDTEEGFLGPFKSAGSTADFYHRRFSQVIHEDTLGQIIRAARMDDFDATIEPEGPGYSAMFKRNAKVAADAQGVLAYTWGLGDVADGGTKHTWDLIRCARQHKVHVSLSSF